MCGMRISYCKYFKWKAYGGRNSEIYLLRLGIRIVGIVFFLKDHIVFI